MFPKEKKTNCTQNLKNIRFVLDVYGNQILSNFLFQYLVYGVCWGFFLSVFYIVPIVDLAISKSKEIL